MLDEIPKGGEDPKFRGSVMLAMAESKEEVLQALKEDIYSKSGVWDWDKFQIYPVCMTTEVFIAQTSLIYTVQICIPASVMMLVHSL